MGSKIKIFLGFILFFLSFVFIVRVAQASENKFFSIVLPIRGYDFWESDYSPLEPTAKQKELVEEKGYSATWLLRPDVFLEEELSSYFKGGFEGHELGIFFEITPKLADQAKIDYPAGEKSDSNRFFLSGYSTDKREKLIDVAFENFKKEFGYYPKSVGAWHIDAFSAEYMSRNYGIASLLLVADQYATDRYRVWGSWWGVPYYPSRNHILIPASNSKDKLNVVVTQWAIRDPVNGYGPGKESIFSVQANDYLMAGLNTDYFAEFLDTYFNPTKGDFGHITLGLENELFLGSANEFGRQLDLVSDYEADNVTMEGFSKWYFENFPNLSPDHTISADDPLGGEKKAIWVMTNKYRVALIEESGKTFVRDLRIYKDSDPEAYLLVANYHPELRVETKAVIDSVKNPGEARELTGSIEDLVSRATFSTKIPFWYFWLLLIGTSFVLFAKKLLKKLKGSMGALLILGGTIIWSLTMVKSGLIYKFGMGFWGPNGHDGVWHIALINNLSKGSFEIPVFAGERLMNYHIGYDLVLSLIKKITSIPAQTLYFQVFPPILAFLVGYLTYQFVISWRGSKKEALWSTFFVYFGAGWGYLVGLIRTGVFGGESTFWSQQAISTLINPPFSLSLILILLGLILLLKHKKKPGALTLILASICFGVLVQVKVYAALLSLGGLLLGGLWEYLRKKQKTVLQVFALSLLLNALLFLPTRGSSLDIIVFRPFWFLETMMGLGDRLGWERYYSAMTNYRLAGNWVKTVVAYGAALFIFVLGNLGTRVVATPLFLDWYRNLKRLSFVEVFLAGVILAGVGVPTLFLQEGTPWNTIQFMYYSLILMGILAGISLVSLIRVKKGFFSIVVLLTLPTTFVTLGHYLPKRPPAMIPHSELEALEFLKDQEKGIVLTFPFDEAKAKEVVSNPPRPLYLYESTAYVAAFSEKTVYFEDEVNLNITGYPWDIRRQSVEEFQDTLDVDAAREFLATSEIKYVYWLRNQRAKLGETQLGLEMIFENSEVTIYKVN